MDQKVVAVRAVPDRSFPPFFLAAFLTFVLPFAGASWPALMGVIIVLFLVGCFRLPSGNAAEGSEE